MDFNTIVKNLDEINDLLEDLEVPLYDSKDLELDQLAPILLGLSLAKSKITELDTMIARYAADKMTAPQMDVDGIQLRRSAKSDTAKWDGDGLLSVLLARSRDERILDEETGEYESEVSAFMRVLKDCASIGYFRVGKKEDKTGLLGHGIDPDEYREKKPVPQKASIVK